MKKNFLWPLYCFSFALPILACWQIIIFPNIPNYYFQHILIYPTLIFILWALKKNLWSVHDTYKFSRPFMPFLIIILIMQFIAHFQSAQFFLPLNSNIFLSACKGILKLLIQIPFVLFFVILAKIIVCNKKAQKIFLYSVIISFICLFLLCLIQVTYVYTYKLESFGKIKEICRSCLETISPYIEARWKDSVYDFYSKGSYTLTEMRINGFFEEASMLASNVSTFFIPFGFGLLNINNKKLYFIGFGIILISTLIMIFSTATTAIPLIFALVLLIGILAYKKYGFILTIFFIMLLSLIFIFSIYTGPINTIIKNKIHSVSNLQYPRLITTLSTFNIIKDNPFIGVGRDWYFKKLHNSEPYLSNLHDLELKTWKNIGQGGDLSAIPTTIAQYGLPITFMILIFLYKIYKKLHLHLVKFPKNQFLRFVNSTYSVWLIFAIINGFASVDFRNPLFSFPFFLSLATLYNINSLTKENN